MDLRSALTEARTTNSPIVREGLHVVDGNDDIEFTLRVLPVRLPHHTECCLLVLFESKSWPALSANALAHDDSPAATAGRDAAWLREELVATRQYLQSIVDDQEAASQELRAAHEEVLSSNEELQSTNEELETTKEELQSSNEELTTVNEQFQSRNRELDALTDELSNFISSAGMAMVTVGRDLRVRRLTPAAQQAFNLLPTDVGRSLEHIKFALAVDGIAATIEDVVASGQPWESETRAETAAGGSCGSCPSAPATTGSTARPWSRWTSTCCDKATSSWKRAMPRWRLCRPCVNRWWSSMPTAACAWPTTRSTSYSKKRWKGQRAGSSGTPVMASGPAAVSAPPWRPPVEASSQWSTSR